MSSIAAETSRLFFRRRDFWRSHGLSVRASGVLANAGCDTVDEVTQLGREYFEAQPNCAERTLAELEKLAGWPPKRQTVVDTIATALALAIGDREEARETAVDVAIALRRSGFILVADRGQK
jgi:hypothetical protein